MENEETIISKTYEIKLNKKSFLLTIKLNSKDNITFQLRQTFNFPSIIYIKEFSYEELLKQLSLSNEDYNSSSKIFKYYESVLSKNNINLIEDKKLIKVVIKRKVDSKVVEDCLSLKEEKVSNITVVIDWKNYTAELEDNETAQNFYQTIIANNNEFLMEDLNENEKYIYLQEKLPNSPKVPEKIESWDIMLYWNNCIVIFYKSFTTTYSYTKIGHIKNMQDLWTESVKVQFS